MNESRVREVVREELERVSVQPSPLRPKPVSGAELNPSDRALIWEAAAKLHPLDEGVETFANTLEVLRLIYVAFRSRK